MNILSKYQEIDTPALLIDLDSVQGNILLMQQKANRYGVALRPHTKTHKIPYLAMLQLDQGACGITVAKVGEAEVMADSGIHDIFIANEIVGRDKLKRIRILLEYSRICVGVDSDFHVKQLEEALHGSDKKLPVRIEVEVGENRSGVLDVAQAISLAIRIKESQVLIFDGIFCHEGHTYQATSIEDAEQLSIISQQYMIRMADAIRQAGVPVTTVSIGSTPSMLTSEILKGITEIRPGTYIFMDAAQSNIVNDIDRCAATVLATVISIPTDDRVVLDAGAKALTAQKRVGGICNTPGNGILKGSNNIRLSRVFDEHGIIINDQLKQHLTIGDKVEIIPNHICPAVNLYNIAYLVSQGHVVRVLTIDGRGKTQ